MLVGDRPISRKPKGNVLSSCGTSSYLNGLDAMALTEKQQKVQVCENNLVRKIMGIKRFAKRRVDDTREEIGVKESLKKKLSRSRLAWAGHVVRMGDEKLAKSADAQKVEGRKRRGSPK